MSTLTPGSHLLNGIGDQPKVMIIAADGASAEIYLHGAHVTSWKPALAGEQLFLSAKSEFGEGAAIRGGVPVIFPQFSLLGPLPRHGLVRNQPWEVARQVEDEVTLKFRDTPATLAIWPYAFLAELSVRVEANRLEMELRIVNTGNATFQFSSALHTYLRVNDLAQANVEGLHGLTWRDANTMVEHLEKPARISFGEEVDRMYYDVLEKPLLLNDGPRQVRVSHEGFPDAVVWNPGQIKSDKLADMEPGGWQHFVCVEAAAAHVPLTLAPNAEWRGRQVLTLQN